MRFLSVGAYQYWSREDTIYNNKLYHILYLEQHCLSLVTFKYCEAIKEDNLKRIYIIDCNCAACGENEVILYDFSKTIDNTVFVGVKGLWSGKLLNHNRNIFYSR